MTRHRSTLTAIAILIVAITIILYARLAPALVTDSDLAVTELYTELATHGQLLVGPYSRFGWHHPGPMYFYVQAPFYAAGGRQAQSLFAVAVAINLVAIFTVAWLLFREKQGWLAALLTAACVAFAWKTPRLLASPWTGHIPILAGVAFIVITAAIVSGRERLLPLAIVFGSFIAQTHLALGPMVVTLSTLSVIGILCQKSISHRTRWRIFAVAAAVWLALWLLPMIEAVAGRGDNVRALWNFFITHGGVEHGARDAFLGWSFGLAGVLRKDYGLPWGGHFEMERTSLLVACALAQILLLIAVTIQARRKGRLFEAALGYAGLLTSAVGLWATTRIEGDILDHEIFWLTATGALNTAVIAAAGGRALSSRLSVSDGWYKAPAVVCTLVLISGFALSVRHLRDLTSFEIRRTIPRRIPLAYQATRDYMGDNKVRRPLIEMQGGSWSSGAGVILRLYKDGIPVAVTEPSLSMFTRKFAPSGDEDAFITISPQYGYHIEKSTRPGNTILLEADPVFVNAIKIVPKPHR